MSIGRSGQLIRLGGERKGGKGKKGWEGEWEKRGFVMPHRGCALQTALDLLRSAKLQREATVEWCGGV